MPETSRSDRKHAQILDAATATFLRHGYAGASMDQVAATAGVSKQTIYKHFRDKEQLFTRLVLDSVQEIDALVQMVSTTLGDSTDPAADLSDLAENFLSALLQPELVALRRLVIAEAERFPHVGRAWYEQGFERVLATLSSCFAQLDRLGQLATPDPALAASHFVGMVLWIPVNRVMFSGEAYGKAEIARLARAGAEAFLAAYGRRAR